MLKKNNLFNRKLIIIIVCITLVGSLSYFLFQRFKDKTSDEKINYTVVKRGSIVNSVATTGKISANLDIDIKCKASGEIIKLPFDVSNFVKKGDLLLKLNPIDEQQIVKQSEMSLIQSQASLAKARQDLINTKTNQENSKMLALSALNSATVRYRELNSKIKQSASLSATGKQSAQATVESVRIKFRDLSRKAEDNKGLFQKGYLSRTEYETSEVALKQADIDLRNAETKLKEQETMNKGDYESAVAAASQSEIEVKNAQTRLKEQNDAVLDLKLKEQDIKSLEARVESDKSSLQNARQRLKETEVYSPIDGVVTNRSVQVGQIITSGISNISQGTTVLTVSDFSRMFIMASVDESDIGKVKIGQEAVITIDAYSGKRFRGKVGQIFSKGVNVSNVVTFTVKIEVLDQDKSILKPEMTANVEIFTLRKNNVMAVDSEAVIRKNKKYFVRVKSENGEPQEREVKIGVNTSDKYEILNGLKEGEKIISGNSGTDNPWRRGGQNTSPNPNQQGNQARRMIMGIGGGSRR